jgi:proline iminopeptidase
MIRMDSGNGAYVITDDGCTLWTAVSGAGRPLVFCHGGPGLWDYFEDLAAGFGDLGRMVRWDQRGCGRSERRGPYTVARSIEDLDTVRRDLGAQTIALYGHSWGATLALRYALAHPERVGKLIYVSGTGIDPERNWREPFHQNAARLLDERAPGWRQHEERGRDHAIDHWSADFVDPATARQHAERLATPWLGINWDCAAELNAENARDLARDDLAPRCRDLPTPTLIIDGARDTRPRWAVDSLERTLPDVRRITLADAGHLPWIEDPAGVRRAVATFVSDKT